MLSKGISAYVGMRYTIEANRPYLRLARQFGFTRLFTSLHIPEANAEILLEEFQALVVEAVTLGFQITADISPRAFTLLQASLDNLEPLRRIGLHALRVDFGFTPAEIARLSRESGLSVEINASTVNEHLLQEIMDAGADPARLQACHNYYPRPETGLSYDLFAERSQIFQKYKIPVMAFISSRKNPRGPIFAGLPTLEEHRLWKPLQAAKHLAACGLVDGILFGDPLAEPMELAGVGQVEASCLDLQIEGKLDLTEQERIVLFAPQHTNRLDPGKDVVRSQEGRGLCQGEIIPRPPQPRLRGSITLDNSQYLRYMGELQVVKKPLPADPKVNVVGRVVPEEEFLLHWITPGRAFRFTEKS
ncbi:MAG TPA: MupG family TIM beta-alpha barrel fold protein [Desulfosporosinus sp.]|nr:MupG family TIM beta-alpha barrel fold protein [Desulfosporosinus sp.]